MTTTITPTTDERATRPAVAAPAAYLVRDPICGMEFNPAGAAATRTQDGETYFFCAERCAREFDRRRAWQAGGGAFGGDSLQPAGHAHDTTPVTTAHAAGSSVPGWLVPALCLAAAAAVLAITVFGVSVSNLLVYGLVLACPLMHIFMMRGHGGHAARSVPGGQRETNPTGATTQRSCH